MKTICIFQAYLSNSIVRVVGYHVYRESSDCLFWSTLHLLSINIDKEFPFNPQIESSKNK